ncbi:MAG: hypothetical protein AAFZ38_04595 [Myxococcota bacterium]
MREALIAIAIVASLLAISLANVWLSIADVLRISWWFIGLGMLVGTPSGVVYHIALYRALKAHRIHAPDWWWNPTRHHRSFPHRLSLGVRIPFYAGAFGAGLSFLGCAGLLLALMRMVRG